MPPRKGGDQRVDQRNRQSLAAQPAPGPARLLPVGNLDLHVATRRGKPFDLELVGRGHGAFFLNTEASTTILVPQEGRRPRAFQPRVVAMAPADMYGDGSFEMLLLEHDGTLWQKDSPVYVRGRPIEEWERR